MTGNYGIPRCGTGGFHYAVDVASSAESDVESDNDHWGLFWCRKYGLSGLLLAIADINGDGFDDVQVAHMCRRRRKREQVVLFGEKSDHRPDEDVDTWLMPGVASIVMTTTLNRPQ